VANIPGTEGPVQVPVRPEGGIEGGSPGYTPLPGGSSNVPQPAHNDVTAQQGAGSGSGGLYPNPGEPANGTIQVGYKGSSYSTGGADNFQPPANVGSEFVTGGPNGSSVGALSVPTTFSEPSTDQG
jgi:hypothetical protein